MDELLGPACGRLFGSGYRRVQHEFFAEPYQDEVKSMALTARVVYPHDWSLGSDGGARRPHLSTIDAVVLALMVLSRSARGRPWARHAHVRRVVLRAGPEPWFQFSAVPLRLRRAPSTPRTGQSS
ncbi:AvrD family protein [Brevibacterium picturae]|uniref:AvrD family protein n=1 Tax=Brevibacterium picturae TaxID=260553 RepID=UPI003D15D41B